MRRPLPHSRWVAAATGCFVLGLASSPATFGQFDFSSGSLLEAQPPAESKVLPFPSGPVEELRPVPMNSPPSSVGASSPSYPIIADACPIAGNGFTYHVGGLARGYYINDQRIEFTGMEDTFAVEGVLNGGLVQPAGDWLLSFETQLFVNQPFDRHILLDTPERRSFAVNFDADPLEISQLYLGARYDDFYMALGRFVTPFGRFYFPNYRNNFDDSPFIRSEAILFRETGLLLQWDPGIWVMQAALTNGSFEQDTNSSKAAVARVGIDQPWYALGMSVKWQDGIGSEVQKEFNNHVGVDAMIRFGSWTLSGEAIYDQYGLRKPGTPLNSITWGRSLYYRDLNNGLDNPINGFGYYVNLGYECPLWSLTFNYGEFYPEHIGNPDHDTATHRGLIKFSRHWTPQFETYCVLLLENTRHDSLDNDP